MSADTVIHRIVRPAVRAAAPTGITPNQVTTARLIAGIAAAIAFAADAYAWQAVGGAIFLLAMLLDRADGELARQTGQTSPWGHRYDLWSDCFCDIIAFVGIGIGQSAVPGGLGPLLGPLLGPVLGLVAGGAIGVLFWQLNVLKLGSLEGYRLSPNLLVDLDDLLALVPVLVWLGLAAPMLWAAAVITPAAAAYLALRGSRQGQAQRS